MDTGSNDVSSFAGIGMVTNAAQPGLRQEQQSPREELQRTANNGIGLRLVLGLCIGLLALVLIFANS